MMSMLRRALPVGVGAVLALLVAASVAFAGAPKFHSATSSVDGAGRLVVSFDERGLGNANVDYTLKAKGTALWVCINGGGKNPSAANKRSVEFPVVQKASFEVRNGRVVATIASAAPSAGGFTCPSGQRLRLANVSYTNVLLTDTTNGVSTWVANASRVLFAI